MRADEGDDVADGGHRGVDARTEVLVDDRARRARCDGPARLGVEDAASHGPLGQIGRADAGAPVVELTGDREALRRAPVHRTDDLHGGLAPAQHVVACPAGEADQVGDDLQGEGAGQGVDRLEAALSDESGDQSVGLGLDASLQSAQRAW